VQVLLSKLVSLLYSDKNILKIILCGKFYQNQGMALLERKKAAGTGFIF
jgi:hypothetical protein